MIQPSLINLHSNKYSEGSTYYPFLANIDRCVGSCITLNDLSNRKCVRKRTEDLNLGISNMITAINESKKLIKTYIMELQI